ncbi:MAG: carbohydrate-binding family 9-like protein [Daejeonella sp.]
MKVTALTLLAFFMVSPVWLLAQQTDEKLAPLLQIPRSYTILKTTQPLTIDGKNDEGVWDQAAWSTPFEDIEGKPEKKPAHSTRFKLLWDEENLYVYCRFDEEHIWANLKEHDLAIFQDNAFEMFIDPDGDTHNYMEFQINAFAAVWDLLLHKPPRNGGPSITDWDIKGLKKGVYINGTLNNPSDKDKFWGIELALPLKTFRFGGNNFMPKIGSTWKMNITRVQREVDIQDGKYVKRTGPNARPLLASYYCWSPQGIINFHYPERWGTVRFAGENEMNLNFINEEVERLKLQVWKYYYLQQDYKARNGKYASDLVQLQAKFPEVSFQEQPGIKLIATDLQFTVQLQNMSQKITLSVDQDGKFVSNILP